jgi:DNA-binding CsgD family transcriptional regulator
MSNALGATFRWEDVDQRLVSPKTLDISEEMHKRAAVGERRIADETAKSGNSAGYLPRLFDFHEQLTDEWIQREYAAYCEAWTQQNRQLCPEFIRALRGGPIAQLIAGRRSSVLGEVGLRAWRIGEQSNPYSLEDWNRKMDRLRARWMRRLESDAAACEYRIRAEQQSGNVSVSHSPESNTSRKATERKILDLSRYLDVAGLTAKQYECASLKWEYGLSTLAIAKRLNRTRKTIDDHLRAAQRKVQSSGQSEQLRRKLSQGHPEE